MSELKILFISLRFRMRVHHLIFYELSALNNVRVLKETYLNIEKHMLDEVVKWKGVYFIKIFSKFSLASLLLRGVSDA